ncbi:MAG: hypothetical protein RLZ75_1102 [Pseudomonadota bacterium]
MNSLQSKKVITINIKCITRHLLGCFFVLFSSATLGNTPDQQRHDFLLAEKLLEQGNDPAFLTVSFTLVDYPLYPYLQYQWLKNNLSKTEQILSFLSAYQKTRYADLLRSDWLEYLADNERWSEFIQNYQSSDNTSLECQFYWAHYRLGNQQLALNEAKRFWVVGYEQPKACDRLLSALALSPLLTTDLVWQRFELALKADNKVLASYVQSLLPKSDQLIADLWFQVHKKSALIQSSQFLIGNEQQGRIFAYGVDRIAKTDLDLAITVWDARKPSLMIDSQTVQQLERRLALALARNQDSRAYNRLNQLVINDAEVREWKIRVALLEQDWSHVAQALAGLTPEEKLMPQWQYWQARSMVVGGNLPQGQTIYSQLAEDRSYYGFMAADAVNKPYALADKPVLVEGNSFQLLTETADFKVIEEFKILNRDVEAKRQWWFALKKLSKDQLKIAAKLAQQWQWHQVAIITLVKAEYWDDLALRFPVNYLSEVQRNANRQDLEPAIIFGLIRQESMMDENAKSAVGALGLMQIMPETGKQIAHKLKESWQSENSLFNPDINIKYGAFYYKQLLTRFDGHFALAMAAYNAGPNRVVKWLPVDKTLPADIWIETIPYKETRKYVTSVLAYATIYQQRMQRNTLKITSFLFDVRPH